MKDASKRRRRFIEYVRVSELGERGDDLLSPELQIESMNAYAERNDVDVIDRVVDLDESGRSFERRAIKGIIERIKNGEADGVLLWKWSRWGRNVERSQYYLRKVKLAGGEVRASTEDIDTSTAMGKAQLNMHQTFDQLLSDQISDGWKAVQARRIKLGLPPGGPPPFGYRRPEYAEDASRHEKPFEPDPVTGPIVKKMYERYLQGHGLVALARWLNEDGVRSNRGNEFTVVTVARILDGGFAAGLLRLDNYEHHENDDGHVKRKLRQEPGRWERGAHEPLIDQQTWEDYRAARASRRRVHPKARQPKWFLGGGLAVCGRCDMNLVVNSYTHPKSEAICSGYRTGHDCRGVWINRRNLEVLVDLWLQDHLAAWADAQDQLVGVDDERAVLSKDLEAARAEETRLNEGRARAARLVARGEMTEEDHHAAIKDAEVARADVTQRIAELTARLDALVPDADVLDRLERRMVTEPEELNVLLKKLLRRVVVAPDVVTIEPWRGKPHVYDRADLPRRERSKPARRDATGRFT
jgi:site-specific DNA recombinase